MKTDKTNTVEETQGVQAENLPATLGAQGSTDVTVYDPGQYAGAGMENISKDEYSIPFLYVLDPKSPQCQPPNAGGVPGAKGGMLYNTATNELFDGEGGTIFLPVHRDHSYVERLKKLDGSPGDFVGLRSPDDPLVLELRKKFGQFGKLLTSEDHYLIETYYLYGLTVTDGVGSPVLTPFKSTGIPAYKNFMTRVMNIQYVTAGGAMVRPPMWAHRWKLGTQYKPAKESGQSGWYVPRLWLEEEPPIKSRLKLTDPLYIQAREFYENIKAGRVVVKEDTQPDASKEIPF